MRDGRYVYAFEEVTDDLPRPPMAAQRALQSVGFVVSPRGWQELPLETKKTIAREGTRDQVGGAALDAAVKRISLQHVKMMPRPREPDPGQVPPELTTALGPIRTVTAAEWRSLSGLDRRVLYVLAHNTRLLGRAIDEILPPGPSGVPSSRSSAVVARCEITVRRGVLRRITAPDFQDGRAFVLARVAGRRAARRVAEIFDAQAESTVGPIELDWGLREADSVIFWQAHASAWDGAFFPSASMLAATTAAVALHDLVKELDPSATLSVGRIRNEPWEAGRGEVQEPATELYANRGALLEQALAKGLGATVVTPPPVMESPLTVTQPLPRGFVPPAQTSTPSLAHPTSQERSARKGPSDRLFILVSVIAVTAVVGLIAMAVVLASSAGLLIVPGHARPAASHPSTP